MPRISVLLPCRDAAEWLADCIDSLEAQTLTDFEVLAVDDRSTDGTGTILRRWADRDARVRVLALRGEGRAAAADVRDGRSHEGADRNGLVAALLLAVEASTAPLLARMDADDVAHPRRLEKQLRFMAAHRDLAACGTAVEMFPSSLVGPGYRRYEKWLNSLDGPAGVARDLFVECPIAHPTLLIRRSALLALGGYRDAGWPEDYDLILRLHAAGMRASNLAEPLVRWRVRKNRHSRTSDRYSPAAFRCCKSHFLVETFLPRRRPLVMWGAGKVGKPLARELARRGRPVDAFVDLDPRKIGQEVHGAPVLDPDGFSGLMRRDRPYVLAAVGSPGARNEIRRALEELECVELRDFRVCA